MRRKTGKLTALFDEEHVLFVCFFMVKECTLIAGLFSKALAVLHRE